VFITYALQAGFMCLRSTHRQDYGIYFPVVILSKHHHHYDHHVIFKSLICMLSLFTY
jgi:hypothetical protein